MVWKHVIRIILTSTDNAILRGRAESDDAINLLGPSDQLHCGGRGGRGGRSSSHTHSISIADFDAGGRLDPAFVLGIAVSRLLGAFLKHGGNEGVGQGGLQLGQRLHEAFDLGQIELDLVGVSDDGGLGPAGVGFGIGGRTEEAGAGVHLATFGMDTVAFVVAVSTRRTTRSAI